MTENPQIVATEIKLRTRTRVLEVAFAAGETVLVLGKENVAAQAGAQRLARLHRDFCHPQSHPQKRKAG
jgi:hypothetical protein